jgi:hypothetical protein
VHTAKSDTQAPVIINPEEDSFPYAYIFKYALTLMGGMVIVLLYNRLSALDKIVTFIENNKDF